LLSLYAAAKSKAKIITKVNSSSLTEIVSEMPVGSLISPRLITAERILRYVRAMQNTVGSNVETLYKMADNRVEALEFRVRTNMSLLGNPLMELRLKKNLLIACINRRGKIIIPGGQDTIEMGDTVIVVTTNTGLSDLSDIIES
jgi:trk system potassium uptake protein TrkA